MIIGILYNFIICLLYIPKSIFHENSKILTDTHDDIF